MQPDKTVENKPKATFHEFLAQSSMPTTSEERVLAFADYFLAFFDSIAQMSAETGFPEEDIKAILINKLEKIDKIKFGKVDIKIKRRRIIEVADYIILNGASTRQAATKFGYSHVAIHDWMTNILPTIDHDKYEAYLKVKDKNTDRSIEDDGVVARIKAAIDLIIGGLTIKEAAEALNSTEMTIERDLKRRLPRLKAEDIDDIGKEKMEKLSQVLKFHSASHPRKQSKR